MYIPYGLKKVHRNTLIFHLQKKLFAYLMPILKKANAYLYLIVQYMGD